MGSILMGQRWNLISRISTLSRLKVMIESKELLFRSPKSRNLLHQRFKNFWKLFHLIMRFMKKGKFCSLMTLKLCFQETLRICKIMWKNSEVHSTMRHWFFRNGLKSWSKYLVMLTEILKRIRTLVLYWTTFKLIIMDNYYCSLLYLLEIILSRKLTNSLLRMIFIKLLTKYVKITKLIKMLLINVLNFW